MDACVAAFRGRLRFALDRFEILNEPTGTYSIFDRYTELPVTVQGRILIGLCRHEVPLALLRAMEDDDAGCRRSPRWAAVDRTNINETTCKRE